MMFPSFNNQRGQSALEYLLLVAVVAAVVFVGFRTFVPNTRDASEGYYNKVTRVILGENPAPINGGWCDAKCPPAGSCGPRAITRLCACPAPAFGGAYCSGSAIVSCGEPDPKCKDCVDELDAAGYPKVCNAKVPECGEVSKGFTACGAACTIPANGLSIPCGSCGTAPDLKPGEIKCPGTEVHVGLTDRWHTVASCSDPNAGKCAISCESATTEKEPDPLGHECVAFYCKQPIANTIPCPSAPEPVAGDVPTHLENDCNDPTECAVICAGFSHRAGNTCLPNTCAGIPQGAKACPNASNNVPEDGKAWTAVANCTNAGPCTYLTCGQFTHLDSNQGNCVANSCAPNQPAGNVCPDSTINVPVDQMEWTVSTTSCTAKCQVLQ